MCSCVNLWALIGQLLFLSLKPVFLHFPTGLLHFFPIRFLNDLDCCSFCISAFVWKLHFPLTCVTASARLPPPSLLFPLPTLSLPSPQQVPHLLYFFAFMFFFLFFYNPLSLITVAGMYVGMGLFTGSWATAQCSQSWRKKTLCSQWPSIANNSSASTGMLTAQSWEGLGLSYSDCEFMGIAVMSSPEDSATAPSPSSTSHILPT